MADQKLTQLSTGAIATSTLVYIVNGTTSAKATVADLQTFFATSFAAASHNHDGVYAAVSHGHSISDITNLQNELNGKAASSHGHMIADVTNLQSELNAKAAFSHGHSIADVTNLQTELDGKAASSHSHAISDVTNLQTTLDGKAATTHDHDGVYSPIGHSHDISDVTSLQTELDGKAASSHSHAISDVTDLQTTLDSKSDTSHSHDGVYSPVGHGHSASDVSDFDEAVDDRVALLLQAGTNVTLVYDDVGGTLTINASGGGGGSSAGAANAIQISDGSSGFADSGLEVITGAIQFDAAATAGGVHLAASSDADCGIYFPGAQEIHFRRTSSSNTTNGMALDGGLALARDMYVGFTSNHLGSSVDLALRRDAADCLAIHRGSNPQSLSIYSTYTDASNYERLRIYAQAGGNYVIGRESAGTGVDRGLTINGNTITLQHASSNRVVIGGTISTYADIMMESGKLVIKTSAPPANSSASGTPGSIAWDADFLYVCTASNTWKRAALSTW